MSMESFKTSMTESVRATVSESIHSEVSNAITPLQEAQKEIIGDLSKTQVRVSALELDNDTTKTKVEELQKQMTSLQQNLSNRPASRTPLSPGTSNLGFRTTPLSAPPAIAPSRDAIQVLRDAKKIVGFSPIRQEDLTYLKGLHSINDDDEAMTTAIMEYLTCEMKVPRSITEKLVLKRVFPPAKPSADGWSTLR